MTRLGAIIKQGNGYLRALLTQAAHTILRHKSGDDPLGRWAKAIDERRGRHIAVVALARRLSGVLWAMSFYMCANEAGCVGNPNYHLVLPPGRKAAVSGRTAGVKPGAPRHDKAVS
ncbi:hypothetical protein [Sorangium sp. So ce233]|uniref:hypothetical protein n=1 Tax=Sorangium sp. So ce233 TaxID=3133290 RepID=UPI003F603A48